MARRASSSPTRPAHTWPNITCSSVSLLFWSLEFGWSLNSTHRLAVAVGLPPSEIGMRWSSSKSLRRRSPKPYAVIRSRLIGPVTASAGRWFLEDPRTQTVVRRLSARTVGSDAPGVQAGSGKPAVARQRAVGGESGPVCATADRAAAAAGCARVPSAQPLSTKAATKAATNAATEAVIAVTMGATSGRLGIRHSVPGPDATARTARSCGREGFWPPQRLAVVCIEPSGAGKATTMVSDRIDTGTATSPMDSTGASARDDPPRGRLYVSAHGNATAGSPEARGEQPAYELLGDTVVIGSGEGADVRLHDVGVAARHVTLVRYDDGHHGLRLVDWALDVRVNGLVVHQPELRLEDGYRIDLGEATLVYRHDEGVRDDTAREGGEGSGHPNDA